MPSEQPTEKMCAEMSAAELEAHIKAVDEKHRALLRVLQDQENSTCVC